MFGIRFRTEWDGKRYHWYINMRTELDNDALPVAKVALTFMVVNLCGTRKLPVGYFFINGLCAEERTNLVNCCIEKLHEIGVTIVSLTFGGCHLMLLY